MDVDVVVDGFSPPADEAVLAGFGEGQVELDDFAIATAVSPMPAVVAVVAGLARDGESGLVARFPAALDELTR